MTQNSTLDTSTTLNTPLAWRIFYDRYALKDVKRETFTAGDLVIVKLDDTNQHETGHIESIDYESRTAVVKSLDGEVEWERPFAHIDKPLETTPEQMIQRVAKGISSVEKTPEARKEWEDKFNWLMGDWKFVPAGRILTAAGSEQQLSLYNCFVIPNVPDSRDGIFQRLSQMAEIMSRGGGVGVNLSQMRPRYAYVKGVNGRSSGSVSWGSLFSFVTGLIEQGGCFGPDERIMTDKGLIPAKELADRIDAGEVFNAHTHKGLRKITARFRNGVKPLYEMVTDRGYRVRITKDHKVAVLMDSEITTIPLKYLQKNDEILLLIEPDKQFSQSANTVTDKIKSIELIGDSEVYDFEVDDVHLLGANGVYSSNSRRGALMLILNDWHPDLLEFIKAKREAGKITNANISVGISDGFMQAVKDDADWHLRFPDTQFKKYNEEWNGDIEEWEKKGYPVINYKTVKAREIWDTIIESAWSSAEPGVWFRERSNKMSNSWYYPSGKLISTNPCVTGDTLIHTDKGLVTALDLFNSQTEIQVTLDGRFGVEQTTTPSTRVFTTGVKPVYRLQTREGYYVRATADHRFMTPSGWVELKDLQPGTKIHVLNRKGGFGSEGSLELGRVLGWVTNYEKQEFVPKSVFQGSEDMQRGFLQGLFTADGGFQDDGEKSVRLSTNSLTLLEGVQQVLSNLGIFSRIYRNRHLSGYHTMRDWNGELTQYLCETQHELVISKRSIAVFAQEIGFLTENKQQTLENYIGHGKRSILYASFTAVIDSITEDGIEQVFDLTEPLTHSMVVNGIVTHQCGEQPLSGFSVCNLGAINLSKFFDEYTNTVNWNLLQDTVSIGVRFLDNVIDATPYFFEENESQQKAERRVGLGIMGLAELLIKLKIRYGSKESLEFIDKLFGFITTQAYKTSALLGKEKGNFTYYFEDDYLESGFVKTLPQETRDIIKENGMRNVTVLTVAPCGSTGTMVESSTGIEPFFSWVYYRKSRLGLHEEHVNVAKQWFDANPGLTQLPDYFVTAMELEPKEHVDVQAAVQRWVCSAISKTANLPNNYTIEQTRELYEYMYDSGCKGGTVYRDGSRDEQVLMLKPNAEQTEIKTETKTEIVIDKSDTLVYATESRPSELNGKTFSQNTPVGNIFVTINTDENNNPFEVFITVGKAGSDIEADAQAIGRTISLLLRGIESQKRRSALTEVSNQLRGIGGRASVGFGINRINSMPDAVGIILSKFLSSSDVGYEQHDHETIQLADIGQDYIKVSHSGGHVSKSNVEFCPECQNHSLINESGCHTCTNCGYSKC